VGCTRKKEVKNPRENVVLFIYIVQGYAVVTVLRNNFDNGWIGFDERTSSHVQASEEMVKPLILTLRRRSSMSFGQLVVSIAGCYK